MLANPQKFQAIFQNCKEDNFTFELGDVKLIPYDVKLLWVNLDTKLIFDYHVSQICKKTRKPFKCSKKTVKMYKQKRPNGNIQSFHTMPFPVL